MLLDEAQQYLEVVRQRGMAQAELRRVYKNICNHKGLFVLAYGKLYGNTGALTPGVETDDVIDGMSMKRIERTIEKLQNRTYTWKPTRRTYIPKKNGKKRPLGIPGWEDKLVQEVLRMVLEAYYEPQFSNLAHGFRPGRGCHTALSEIYYTWKGIKWFVEGDIKGCFDNISHKKVLETLRKQVKDENLLQLLKEMMKAGYVEDWTYYQTYSGTPQGGVISPLLANILLNELDSYIENELIPEYTKGDKSKRKWSRVYQRLNQRVVRAKRRGDIKAYQKAVKDRRKVAVFADDGCTWLRYVRYADDFLLGFAGSKKEAIEIKTKIGKYLENLQLEMSVEKTLITNGRTGKARFLNYHIHTIWKDSMLGKRGRGKGRRLNGNIGLTIPKDVMTAYVNEVMKEDKVLHKAIWRNNSDYDIVMAYEAQVQGIINYYEMAHDVVERMTYLRYVYGKSLGKTLANKHQCPTTPIYRQYAKSTEEGRWVMEVVVEREGKKPLVATYGKKPITQNRDITIHDEIKSMYTGRNEMVTRLLNDVCEICGSNDNVQGHHIRKLSDLKRYEGKESPDWVKKMAAMRRKTLFVCKKHHDEIHHGRYDGARIT